MSRNFNPMAMSNMAHLLMRIEASNANTCNSEKYYVP